MMFVKVVNDNTTRLFETQGNLEYGLRYFESSPTDPDFDLREVGPIYQYAHVLFAGGDTPTGYRHFPDSTIHPDEPYWRVSWASWQGNEGETVVFTVGDIYILGENGKTLDKVK